MSTTMMVSADHAVPIEPAGGTATVTVLTGDTIYFADTSTVTASINQGSIANGANHVFSSPAWIRSASLSSIRVDVAAKFDDVVLGTDGLVGGPGGTGLTGTVEKVVSVPLGNMGATPSVDLGSTANTRTMVTGTLNANAALTLANLAVGQMIYLLLTQDGTGARTLNVNGGSVPIPSAANASMAIECDYDGANLYVSLLGGGGGGPVTATQQSGTGGSAYTFALADAETVVEATGATAATFTIPPHASVAWPTGTIIEVFQDGAGQVTIAAGAGVTLRSDGAKVKTAARYATIGLRCRAVDEWVLSGDLA